MALDDFANVRKISGSTPGRKGACCKSKLTKHEGRYMLDECSKTKVESKRTEANALKNAFSLLMEWGLILISKYRNLKVTIETLNHVLNTLRNVVIS